MCSFPLVISSRGQAMWHALVFCKMHPPIAFQSKYSLRVFIHLSLMSKGSLSGSTGKTAIGQTMTVEFRPQCVMEAVKQGWRNQSELQEEYYQAFMNLTFIELIVTERFQYIILTVVHDWGLALREICNKQIQMLILYNDLFCQWEKVFNTEINLKATATVQTRKKKSSFSL